MPGFDGTGPQGMGPMTGGARGYCASSGMRRIWRPYGGRGWAGYGAAFIPFPSRQQELEFLKEEAGVLKRTLEEIDAKIRQLKEESK